MHVADFHDTGTTRVIRDSKAHLLDRSEADGVPEVSHMLATSSLRAPDIVSLHGLICNAANLPLVFIFILFPPVRKCMQNTKFA